MAIALQCIIPDHFRRNFPSWEKVLKPSPQGVRRFSKLIKEQAGLFLTLHDIPLFNKEGHRELRKAVSQGADIGIMAKNLALLPEALEEYRITFSSILGQDVYKFIGEPFIEVPIAKDEHGAINGWLRAMTVSNVLNELISEREAATAFGVYSSMNSPGPTDIGRGGSVSAWDLETAAQVFERIYSSGEEMAMPSTQFRSPTHFDGRVIVFPLSGPEIKV